MFELFKYLFLKLLVLSCILFSSNVLACTPDDIFIDTSLFSVQEFNINDIQSKTQRNNTQQQNKHHHHAVSASFDVNAESSRKNCQCCEYCQCISCVGCSTSSGFATMSTPYNNQSSVAPLDRFAESKTNYASLSPSPLKHPPK